MPTKERINDFIQRWNIDIPNDRLFNEFKSRVNSTVNSFISDISRIDWYHLYHNLENNFARINGSIYEPANGFNKGKSILVFFSNAPGFFDLILYLQRLFWAIEKTPASSSYIDRWNSRCKQFVGELNNDIDLSVGINLRKIAVSKGSVELYPEGIAILDNVVDQNIIWLKNYPETLKEFQNALRIASTRERSSYRNALDNLRFGLEKLIKTVLQNDAPLEKQKEYLLKWMKGNKVHPQIRNNYGTILNQFVQYQNDTVKHPDPEESYDYSDEELEYMIYLSSTLMRFILKLKNN